jgi:hypothetical protein
MRRLPVFSWEVVKNQFSKLRLSLDLSRDGHAHHIPHYQSHDVTSSLETCLSHNTVNSLLDRLDTYLPSLPR